MKAFDGRFAAGMKFSVEFIHTVLGFLNDYDIN